MQKIVLINISNTVGISGVGRYLNCLTDGLKHNSEFELYWIDLTISKDLLFHKIEKRDDNITKITIPMAEYSGNIITHEYFMDGYCDIVWNIIFPYFNHSDHLILHLHTLNTISLALKIKDELKNVSIITHLHCIPWKNKLNYNKPEFNKLYKKYYTTKDECFSKKEFTTNFTEHYSYDKSDRIICVTQCARDFLIKTMGIEKDKISLIYNGMADINPPKRNFRNAKRLKLLFVGSVIPSKGIEFIIQTMNILHERGVETELRVAGVGAPFYIKFLKSQNKHLHIKFMGRLSFEELSRQYRLCDIGLMISLQEQCSYAAIEMAMFGMTMVVTSVDGLDEMFKENIDCLKVNTIFDNEGVKVDTQQLADHIEHLKNSQKLRKSLSKNSRARFLEKFQIDEMLRLTTNQYAMLSINSRP